MSFTIVAYYTKDSIYEEYAKKLISSLKEFKLNYNVQMVDSKGDWYLNTNYKPTFIREMLDKYKPNSIVYVDCDAEFKKYPKLFDKLDSSIDCNMALYLFDKKEYGKNRVGFELLSGTIFLKNNEKVYELVKEWEGECKSNGRIWDQRSLEKVIGSNFYKLPGEYCKIFDRMNYVKDPVIVHYQASRKVRKNRRKIPDRFHSHL